MGRRLIAWAACLAALSTQSAVAAPEATGPSALVQLTQLSEGSLPRTLVAYGRIRAAASATRTVMAPVLATVGALYVRRGEEVAEGARLIELLPSPRSAAAFQRARTALEVARQLLARTRSLFNQHLATAQQVANAEKSESDARADLDALQAQGAGGPNLVRAPFHAIVTSLSTTPGAIVAEGAQLLELARPGDLVLNVGLQPNQAAAVVPGDRAEVTAIGAQRAFPGRVRLRGSVVDAASGLVPVEITLPSGHFLPGESARVSITTGAVHGYVVPHEAVLVDEHGRTYVVQAAGTRARWVPVIVLAAQGDRDVIEGSGLDASQALVLSGNYQLQDGMSLRVAKPTGPRTR
jgi:membrane fusion protein (multidrug efflux system)